MYNRYIYTYAFADRSFTISRYLADVKSTW